MGVSPTPPDHAVPPGKRNFMKKTSHLIHKSKRRKRELQREAKAEIKEARSKFKKNVSSFGWWYKAAKLCTIILFYFCSSVALTFYQKDLIVSIPFPLSMVVVHLVLKFLMASLCRSLYSKFCYKLCTDSSSRKRVATANRRTQENNIGKERVVLTWEPYFKRVALVSAASGLDIGLSQWSLEFVTVALYTMGKSTCILFVLFFGLLFKLEKKHWSQIVIVLLITAGLGLFNFKSTTFSPFGFIIIILSALMCGLRWTTSQLVMQKSSLGLDNPIDMIYHVQPMMILTLLPLAVAIEGIKLSGSMYGFRFESFGQILHTGLMVSGGGLLAFFMELSEYLIVTTASSLALSIIGVSKELVTVSVSLVRNNAQLSALNFAGMIVCFFGVIAHVIRKAIQPPESKAKNEPGRGNQKTYEKFQMDDFDVSESSDDGAGQSTSLGRRYNPHNTPLLHEEDWSSSDEDVVPNFPKKSANDPVPKKGNKSWEKVDDDFFFRESRTWTSTRDSHLSQMANSQESPQDPVKSPHKFVTDLISSD